MTKIAPIIIKRLSKANFRDVDQCDGTFLIDSELVLSAKQGQIIYDIVEIEPYKKRYVPEKNRNLRAYINSDKGVVYLAYIEEKVCGQMIISAHWNNFALIEDLEVDVDFRRQGVAAGLIMQAKTWAKVMGLAGVTLETQNNNVAACKFYQRCGFELRGFDNDLYKGMNPQTREIALFWYYVFKGDEGLGTDLNLRILAPPGTSS